MQPASDEHCHTCDGKSKCSCTEHAEFVDVLDEKYERERWYVIVGWSSKLFPIDPPATSPIITHVLSETSPEARKQDLAKVPKEDVWVMDLCPERTDKVCSLLTVLCVLCAKCMARQTAASLFIAAS